MLDVSSITKRLSKCRYHVTPKEQSFLEKCETSELQDRLELDSNDTIAIVAYSEALETMAIKSELIDSLLIEEMSSAIDGYQETSELINSESVSRALLPKAKEVIHDCYVLTRQGTDSHEDTYRQTHEEFGYDLLQSLTHIYAKSFIRQYYLPIKTR